MTPLKPRNEAAARRIEARANYEAARAPWSPPALSQEELDRVETERKRIRGLTATGPASLGGDFELEREIYGGEPETEGGGHEVYGGGY